MKLHYDRETDSLYIELLEKPGVNSDEIEDGIVLDFDENHHLVGIDVQHASKNVDLKKLDPGSLPLVSAGK
jgi:uncharacterized protein YuzE